MEFAEDMVGVPDAFGRFWTPHRMAYIQAGPDQVTDEHTCPFCAAPARDDESSLIVHRGATCFVILNLYPYNPGHLLVCPYRHIPMYTDATAEETQEMADLAQTAMIRARAVIDLAEALLTAAALTEPEHVGRYGDSAAATVQQAALILARAPRAAGHWLAVAEASVRGPIQIAVVGADAQLLSAARSAVPGGSVVVAGEPDSAPLLAGRPLVGGAAAAYVCRGFVCDRPVTDVPELLAALAR